MGTAFRVSDRLVAVGIRKNDPLSAVCSPHDERLATAKTSLFLRFTLTIEQTSPSIDRP